MTISLLNWEYQFNMKHNWNLLSNERKTKRSLILGILAIASYVIWYEDILQWRMGGPFFVITPPPCGAGEIVIHDWDESC